MKLNYRVAVVTEIFPSVSETFIARQVQALNADVVTTQLNRTALENLKLDSQVRSLTDGRSLKGGIVKRSLTRMRRLILGFKAPVWPRYAQANWGAFLEERRPDVVLAQFAQNAMRCMEGCRKHSIPLVVHTHGMDVTVLPHFKRYREALPRLFNQAAAVVAVSEVMLRMLEELGCPSSKLCRIPCGVPIGNFSLGNCQAEQPCHFLAVSRFVPKKSPFATLKAFVKCVRECPGTTLTMIGGGPLLSGAKRWAEQNDAIESINFMGVQPIEIVQRHMIEAGCFVQHSVRSEEGDMEGWPVAIAEAHASGLPVVSTRHSGIPEIVLDGVTGYLVEEGDWQGMADRMIELAKAPDRRKQMGLAGRRHIELHGNFQVQIRKLASLLENVAGGTIQS